MTTITTRNPSPGPIAGRGSPPMSPAEPTRPIAPRAARPESAGSPAEHEGSRLKRISDVISGIHKLQFGRGPDRCRTFQAGPDTMICLVDAGLSAVERRLVEIGEGEQVRSGRQLVMDAARSELMAAIGTILGRDVRLLISGIDVRHDVTTLTFLLA